MTLPNSVLERTPRPRYAAMCCAMAAVCGSAAPLNTGRYAVGQIRDANMRSALTTLIGVVALCSCDSGDARAVSRRSMGDTTLVVSPTQGTEGPVELRELQRVRAVALNKVEAGAFGEDGRFWVFDAAGDNGPTLSVLDSLGARLAIAGREGSGPGEYRAPVRIFRLAHGSMLLKEMQTPRAVRFGREGQVLATLTLPAVVSSGWVITPDTSGGWYIAASFEVNTAQRVGRYGWLHFRADGSVRDTVLPPLTFFDEPTPLGIAPGRVRTVARDGRVFTSVPGPNRLTALGPGPQVMHMEWGGVPAAYGAAERADQQAVADKLHDMLGVPHATLPERKQPIHRILTDRAGQTWALLSMPGVPIAKEDLPREPDPLTVKWREPERWAAFAPDGSLRFQVTIPESARILDRSDDRLLGVVADASGAEELVVWRIVRAGALRN